MTNQPPESGAVPTSSSRNRFATKRMLVISSAIAAVVLLGILFAVASGVTA